MYKKKKLESSSFGKFNKPKLLIQSNTAGKFIRYRKMGMENSSAGIYQRKLIYNRGFIN